MYYNPETKKVLHSVKGTDPTNIKDLYTDAMLSMGMLKKTDRYKDSHKKLREAKAKYGTDTADVVGHSLGSGIASYISDKNKDKVYTLDKATTIGGKTRSNEQSYRTKGDLVSIFNKNSKRTKTLDNPNKKSKIPIIGKAIDALRAHDVDNIKGSGITIANDEPESFPVKLPQQNTDVEFV